ncbi:Zinc finger CCCH domain-containing protein 7 [Glycine soja]
MDQHHFLHHHHYHHPQEHRNRYTSLTPQSHLHSHHHNNLPPPPPNPSPPLSYHRTPQPYTPPTPQPQHQQQQFPYTPLPDRPLEEEPQPQRHIPYDLLPRRTTTLPWNPNPNPNPRIPDDFDRDYHHKHHRPLPPPPPPIESHRYDPDRHHHPVDPYEQNPREPLAWGGGGYHAPGQGDVDPTSYVRVYTVESDADVAGRTTSKRWVMSDRDRGREMHESSSGLVSSNGNSEKYYHGSENNMMGRYSRGNSRECGHTHEFERTPPKKQVQKKSALLRIQTVKPNNNHRNRENREVEQLRYPGYGSENGNGFYRGKEQYFGHGVKGEEREESPVEIDISFESNSLVAKAKAVVAPLPPPSSSVSVPDLNVMPVSDSDLVYGERSKRVSGSEGDYSGMQLPQPVRMSSVVVDLNRSPCKGNDSSGSRKEVIRSNKKNVDDGSSRSRTREADGSRGKKEVPNFVKVGNVVSGKLTSKIVKKKKIVKRVVKKGTASSKSSASNSLPAKTLPGTVKAESVARISLTASGPEKIEANLDEKSNTVIQSNTVDEEAKPDCLPPLPKEGNVLKEDAEVGLLQLSLGPDSRSQECKSDKDSGIGKVSRFERDGNISNSLSCASISEDKKSDSDCLDANDSVHDIGNTISVHDNANTSDCLDANNSVLNTYKVTKSLSGSNISVVTNIDYDNKQLCQNEVSLSPGKYSNVGSPQNRNLEDVGDELLKSSDTFSCSGKTRIQDGLDCLQHASALKHSSDNGSSNLEDSTCVDCSGIMHCAGKQVSPGDVVISPENWDTEKAFPNSNISVGSGEGDTNKIKKRRARTLLNFLSSEMECLSSNHVNPDSLANNVDGGSSLLLKDPSPSEVLEQPVQSLDFNSLSGVNGVTALHGKGGVLEAQFCVGHIDNDDANEVSPASKRKKVTANPNFTKCQSELSAVIVPSTTSEAPMSFSDNQEHQKEVAFESMGMIILSSAQSMPYSEDITKMPENVLAGGSFESIDANKETMSSEHLELWHSDIVSFSPCEDLAFPNVQFSSLEGECKENTTPIVPTSNIQTDILAVGNIAGEKTDLQAVEENYQYREHVQRSPRADMEPNDHNMKNDLLAQWNLMSCPASGDEVTTNNSNDEVIEDAPGLSDMFSQGMVSEVPDRRVLEFTAINDENIFGVQENPDSISMVGHDSNLNTSSIQQTKKNMKSDHAIEHSNLITKKTMSEQSQVSSKVTTQALNSYCFGLSGTKNQSGSIIPKTFPGHSFTFSKTSASSPHVSKPRTWHRTGNNPPASLPRIKPSVGTVPPKKPILEMKGNFQNTSYVRKGNSLVRKPTPVSTLPHISSVNQTSLGIDEIPKSIKSGGRADVTDKQMYLRTGATNAPQQRTPPLPIDTKSEENTSSSLVEPPSGGCCENASDLRKFIETDNIAPNSSEDALKHYETLENQPGPSDNGDSQGEAIDGNVFPLNTKRIVYIKPKTNQLVATSNSCDVSVSTDDNLQTAFSDGYYKRRKNQLIRTTFESHINQTVAMSNNTAYSGGQGTSNALCNRRFSKRRTHKVGRSSCKRSRASLVWTLCSKNSSENDRDSQHYQRALPQLFPWKRPTFASSLNNSSLSAISKKLLQLRKRDTVYTRSIHGFSLQKSRVLGVGGCSLKWSKSIEKKSKLANEEATLAVAAVERKRREQKNAVCISSQSKSRKHSFHESADCAGERIFRIGSVRYRMDPSRRTLQRISDDESLSSASTCSGLASKRAYIPRRLVIGNDEYVQIGNGNQLIRDPKRRTRKLANEKVRWSLHTARQRLARKQKYCQFFTRFGKCNKDGGKCPYIHDPSKIAVCTKFLNGLCSTPNCKLTHKVIPERMPDCSYFLQGLCSNRNCPYRHVNVNPKASICEGFLKGYCADGNECRKKHSYVCPTFEATGTCTQGTGCKLHHPKKQSKGKKRKRTADQNNSRGRYFGFIPADVSKSGMMVAPKRHRQNGELEEELSDYISLDVVNEEVADVVDQSFEPAAFCDNDSLDLQLDDFDGLIKPVLLLKTKFTLQSPQSSSLQAFRQVAET